MSIEALNTEGQIVRYTDRRRWLWSLSLLWPLLPVVADAGRVADDMTWYYQRSGRRHLPAAVTAIGATPHIGRSVPADQVESAYLPPKTMCFLMLGLD